MGTREDDDLDRDDRDEEGLSAEDVRKLIREELRGSLDERDRPDDEKAIRKMIREETRSALRDSIEDGSLVDAVKGGFSSLFEPDDDDRRRERKSGAGAGGGSLLDKFAGRG